MNESPLGVFGTGTYLDDDDCSKLIRLKLDGFDVFPDQVFTLSRILECFPAGPGHTSCNASKKKGAI